MIASRRNLTTNEYELAQRNFRHEYSLEIHFLDRLICVQCVNGWRDALIQLRLCLWARSRRTKVPRKHLSTPVEPVAGELLLWPAFSLYFAKPRFCWFIPASPWHQIFFQSSSNGLAPILHLQNLTTPKSEST